MKKWLAIFFIFLVVFCGCLVLDSCKKQSPAFLQPPNHFTVPPGFPQTLYNFSGNPLSNAGFLLGRKLFYDQRLSVTNDVACGSCHQPVAAFTTFDHDRSHGINGHHTLRNAPGLFNLAWYPYFNQDGSTSSLHSVYEKHITDTTEMGETIPHLITKLQQDATYKSMFRSAFGDDKITADKIYKALDQFMINLVSSDSKYDKVKLGRGSFTNQEQRGYDVFKAKCASCHTEPLFTDFSFRNIGLEVDPGLNDFGRMRVTGNKSDSLKFRVPSLRNLEFTSYYSHDGRINLPRNVLKFYQNGVNQSATLDPQLSNGIQLTASEEDDLIAFLRTLSDSSFLNNPRFRQ